MQQPYIENATVLCVIHDEESQEVVDFDRPKIKIHCLGGARMLVQTLSMMFIACNILSRMYTVSASSP